MKDGKIRYAVVGLGHIAQAAVLPGFKNARGNSELTALVSHDPRKHSELGKMYGVKQHFDYGEYERALAGVDAVYIALPNHLHHEFAVRAAEAGVHVLCEKPLALNSLECAEMVSACTNAGVKLMTAYRLHFQRANLDAIEHIRAGKIGEPRIFNSIFSMQVRNDNIRVRRATGGGTIYDLGVYCINAARYLFQDEPVEILAASVQDIDERSREVDAATSAILRFPHQRLASFTTSFAAADEAVYEVIGDEGKLVLRGGYEYSQGMRLELTSGGKTKSAHYRRRDQFGAEISYFSDCILEDRPPEPSGIEGWIDVEIVEGIYRSARTGQAVGLAELRKAMRPSLEQERHFRLRREPRLVNVAPPTRDE